MRTLNHHQNKHPMTYTIRERDAIQVVEVRNLLNELDNHQILRDVQNKIQNGFNKIIVDLADLDFMNSVGLNFMIKIMSQSKASGGKLAVANANAQVLKLLEITKLRNMFHLSPSVEDAFVGLD